MQSFKQFLNESINDKGIFKAIFIIGLPGSGKSYTVEHLKGTISPKIINTDHAAEFLSSKWKKQINSDTWKDFEDKSIHITKTKLKNYLNSCLPLFIDGTSNDISNILHRIGVLESLGYDIGIIYIKTDLNLAIQRTKDRVLKNNRVVDEDFIHQVHNLNEENAKYLKTKVDFFKEINNNGLLTNDDLLNAFKVAQSFFNENMKNPIGIRMIQEMKNKKEKYLSPNLISPEMLSNKVDGWYRK